MSDHITLDVQEHVATITLNRPDARNALSLEMRTGLADFAARLEFDADVRCVVLRGAGGHFMAGGDIKAFKRRQDLSPADRKREVLQGLDLLHQALMRLRRMPKPVLASVQGAAAGAGVSLMAACDLAIAADDAFFYFGYANLGLSPDGSGTYFLPRLLGLRRTLEMALLPERMDAATALSWGLVNRVVPAAALAAETRSIAARLAAGPTYAFGRAKALLEGSFDHALETQLELEARAIADCMTTADHEEGVNAFLDKRKPAFAGR